MAVNGTGSASLDVIVSWTFGFWSLGLRGVELNGLCNVALIALKVALIALVGLLRVIGDMNVEEGSSCDNSKIWTALGTLSILGVLLSEPLTN